jgi:hypothetical protein
MLKKLLYGTLKLVEVESPGKKSTGTAILIIFEGQFQLFPTVFQ